MTLTPTELQEVVSLLCCPQEAICPIIIRNGKDGITSIDNVTDINFVQTYGGSGFQQAMVGEGTPFSGTITMTLSVSVPSDTDLRVYTYGDTETFAQFTINSNNPTTDISFDVDFSSFLVICLQNNE